GAPPGGGPPADPYVLGSGRRAGRRPPDGPHRPGQEGQARQTHLHPGARDRRKLHRARRRCRRRPRLSGREARQAMTAYDWFALVAVLFCFFFSAFFSGGETALFAWSRAPLPRLPKQGGRGGARGTLLLYPPGGVRSELRFAY